MRLGLVVYLPPEPEQLGWRDAFWRLCARFFVRRRLRRDQSRAAEVLAFTEARRDRD